MTKLHKCLPQMGNRLFLTDGGLETTLVFHKGIDLPCFAAYVLLQDRPGREILKAYYEPYVRVARAGGYGFVLDSATWRANPDWGAKLGHSREALAAANRDAISLLSDVKQQYGSAAMPMVISGAIGPRGDGYVAGEAMSVEDAERYHGWQIAVLADTACDMVTAFTMTNIPEATGIARAAARIGIPAAISFTVETDARLPSGDTLQTAIETVDAETGGSPVYYMINCAHPDHFGPALMQGGGWLSRLKGVRANASRRSHAELDQSSDLDDGDPQELGALYEALRRQFPQLTILGGCCGTDDRHVACIGHACRATAAAA